MPSFADDAAESRAAYVATRSLLRARDALVAQRVVLTLCRALGAEVSIADADRPDSLPMDISVGEGAPLLPVTGDPHVRALVKRYLVPAVTKPAPAPREPAGTPGRIDEVRVLGREHETLVEEATRTAFASRPTIRNSEAATRATREDLAAILRVIGSATLVDDLALVTEYVRWFEAVLVGHGHPPAFVPSAFELLLGVLPEELACTRDTARSGHDACSGPGLGPDYSL